MRREITPQQLAAMPNAVILDVRRSPDDEQIPGALRFDADALMASPQLPSSISRGDHTVVYCETGDACRDVAERLCEEGYDAWALAGGWDAWRVAGLPTEPR